MNHTALPQPSTRIRSRQVASVPHHACVCAGCCAVTHTLTKQPYKFGSSTILHIAAVAHNQQVLKARCAVSRWLHQHPNTPTQLLLHFHKAPYPSIEGPLVELGAASNAPTPFSTTRRPNKCGGPNDSLTRFVVRLPTQPSVQGLGGGPPYLVNLAGLQGIVQLRSPHNLEGSGI